MTLRQFGQYSDILIVVKIIHVLRKCGSITCVCAIENFFRYLTIIKKNEYIDSPPGLR